MITFLIIYLSLAFLVATLVCLHPRGRVSWNDKTIYNPVGRFLAAWFIFAAWIPLTVLALAVKIVMLPFILILKLFR